MDTVKQQISKAKGTVDGQVDKYSDKLPGKVAQTYGKASDAVGKVLPDDEPEHEKIIKGD
jgi:uncharacterized protein YjbJ (UPF0337 family)